MPKINIDGIGMVEVDDGFTSLSPDEQNATIEEIISSQEQPKAKGEKEWDWISDVTGTIGSVAGGVGGAFLGSLAGPVGTVGGAVTGSSAGGAAGGALGEYIEGLIPGQERAGHDVASTAIQEGAFGLIPGVGGVLTKGGARAGSRVLGKLPIIGKFLGTDQIAKEFAKLSFNQKQKVLDPLVLKALKSAPKGGKLKKEFKDDILQLAYGSHEIIDKFFKKYKGKPQFEKAVNKFYTDLVKSGVIVGGGVSAVARGPGGLLDDTGILGPDQDK